MQITRGNMIIYNTLSVNNNRDFILLFLLLYTNKGVIVTFDRVQITRNFRDQQFIRTVL